MARITLTHDGRRIDFDPADAPFEEHGRPGSLLDVLLGHGVALDHNCGGVCACTTCMVYVERGGDALSAPGEDEEDMLDRAAGLRLSSRLACQAVVEDAEAELVVTIP